MLEALDARYRGSTTTDIILVLGELHSMEHSDAVNMSLFVDQLGDMLSKLNEMKLPVNEIMQVGLLLAKILKSSNLHAAAASLRLMDSDHLTWAMVTNRLIAEHKTVRETTARAVTVATPSPGATSRKPDCPNQRSMETSQEMMPVLPRWRVHLRLR